VLRHLAPHPIDAVPVQGRSLLGHGRRRVVCIGLAQMQPLGSHIAALGIAASVLSRERGVATTDRARNPPGIPIPGAAAEPGIPRFS
jgi:hypothetical protein